MASQALSFCKRRFVSMLRCTRFILSSGLAFDAWITVIDVGKFRQTGKCLRLCQVMQMDIVDEYSRMVSLMAFPSLTVLTQDLVI
ncbi:hypothetical protein Dimus_022279 [Dionaea muscipula]